MQSSVRHANFLYALFCAVQRKNQQIKLVKIAPKFLKTNQIAKVKSKTDGDANTETDEREIQKAPLALKRKNSLFQNKLICS